ncbi:hypothetical protein FACS1894203_5600 [Bacteroidia bacterium]|nr:hypothetical protein FACS1894203_5600 [Bacteroidia bacterium]
MDGDDIAYFDRLQVQFEFMESNLQYLATGSNIEFFSDNNIQPYLSERIQDPEKNKVWLLKDNFFSHPTLFVRKKVFEYYKIRYSENYYYAADYDLILSISQVGNITNISKPLLRYRIHRNQITALKRQEQIMYADQIRLKQLSFLRMRPSVEEMMVHLSLMKDYPIPELKLSLAEKWCNKLLMKNNRLKVYNQEYLYEFLKERLMCAVIK